MGASTLMSLGVRAMAANYAALQTTGHNIANANVAGYSRQEAEFATSQGQFTGAGFFGKGVDVKTVSRVHDAFLTREAVNASSLAAADASRLDMLQQLESVFRTGEAGIGYAAGELLNAMSDLANRPGDTATREVVLGRAREFAARTTDAGARLDALQRDVRDGLADAVTEVNGLAQGIARLNREIAAVIGSGQPPNDLLDERERLVQRLAGQLQVTTIPADDGTLGVFVAGGQRLVLGGVASTLVVGDDAADPARAVVGVADDGLLRPFPSSLVGAGAIAGLLRFQEGDLADARNAIGQLAAAVAGAINEQQQRGLNLHQPAGSVPAQALFAIGAPQALPDTRNARDAAGVALGGVTLGTVSPRELQASDYQLEADTATPGRWRLTRLSDGQVTSVASGDVVDGMRIDVTGAPAASDRFLLRPAARATQLRVLLDDPRDLAAASPLTATVGSANAGSTGVASLTMTGAASAQQTATVTFGAGGAYAWELRDRTTNALVGSGTGSWQPGQTLPPAGAADINGFTLSLTGVPVAGDTLTVGPTPYPAHQNGNALALAALRSQALVGVRMAGGVPVGGAGATDAYAGVLAGVGVRVQTAETAAAISASAAGQAESRRAAGAGVNLDEEAARLLQFQQSYQAAAKVLQVAQSIFDTLLDVAGR